MAQNIKLKRSSVPGKVPTTAQLAAGEIAINTADGKLYFERDDSTVQTIVTTNSNVTGSINIIGAITGSALQAAGLKYPTADGTANQTLITDGAGNLSFGSLAATTAANTVITVKNVSGGTIEKGTPLYITGSGTGGNIVGVWPADAGNRLRMPALAIAGEQLLDEAEGIALLDGFISGVNTSAFASGDEVFVAVGGGYTNVPPTGSGVLIQKLGNVEKVHPSNGSGVINGPNAARSLPNWETGRVMVGSPTYPVTSSFTYFDEANSRLGIGTDNPAERLHVSGSGVLIQSPSYTDAGFTVSDDIYDYRIGTTPPQVRSNYIHLQRNSSNTRFAHSSGDFIWVNGSTEVARISATGDLTVPGIITAQEFHTEFVSASIIYQSGSTKFGNTADDIHSFTGSLRVDGTLRVDQGINLNVNSGQGELGMQFDSQRLYLYGGSNRTVSNGAYIQLDGNDFGGTGAGGDLWLYTGNEAGSDMYFNTGATTRMFISQSGNVGIGTTSPTHKLTVTGDISGSGRLYVGTVDNAATDTDKFLVLNGQEVEYRTGAQVLSDIGAQAAGNYVTDAGGATGQVGVWSSATAMSGSNQLYWNGTSLGINTASPSTTLDVVGAGTTSVDLAHFANSNQTAKILLSLDGVGSSLISMLDASNNEDIRLSTQGASWFNAGALGIGTNAPGYPLDILNNSTRFAFSTTTGDAILYMDGANGDLAGGDYTALKSDSLGNFSIDTGASERIRITAAGNVGIGTTNPVEKLTVIGAISASSHVYAETYRSSRSDGDTYIQATGASDFVALGTQVNVDIVKVNGGGSVQFTEYGSGTNTGTPAYTLAVDSSGNIIEIDNSGANLGSNTDVDTGTEVVDTFASGSGFSAFTRYVVYDGTNYRAGQLMSVWSTAGSIQYTDVSTADIGSTEGVLIFSEINGANIEVKATVPSNNWTVRVNSTLL